MSDGYGVQIRSVPADRAEADAVPLSQVVLEHHRTEGIRLTDVRVSATGGFEGEEPTTSTGITYQVYVSGDASEEQLRALISEVDRIASIPDVLRRPTAVSLSDVKIDAAR